MGSVLTKHPVYCYEQLSMTALMKHKYTHNMNANAQMLTFKMLTFVSFEQSIDRNLSLLGGSF